MEASILALTLTVLMLSFLAVKQRFMNEELRKENTQLKEQVIKTKSDKDSLVSIDPGDKAIIPLYGLVTGKGSKEEHHFEVTYEVDVVEITLDKVKVRATGFTSNDSKIMNDTSCHAGIVAFMKDKWVKRKDIELVVDDSMRRDAKLQELL